MNLNSHRFARLGAAAATLCFLAALGGLTNSAGAATVDVSSLENLRPVLPSVPHREFRLTDFGAVGDGRTDNTAAFARAISAVEKAGGGTLIVPRGTFLTGAFSLCSQLELHLDQDAIIQAPDTFKAFGVADPATLSSQEEVKRVKFPGPLITGHKLHDVAITGPGAIDGSGALWWAWSERAARAQPGRLVYQRAHLVVLEDCERVQVADVTLRNSPKFHLVLRRIHELTIERVKVRAPSDAPNTDAIDPGPVTNALIRDCDIDTGDDDIAIKSGGKNVLIENCTIKHGHGISIGSETTVGVSNMLVRNCTFDGTDNGIRIKSMRGAGGRVENVRYTQVQMKNVEYVLVLDLTYVDNNRPNFKGTPGKIPSIQNVLIDHLRVEGAKHAGRIIGLPESPIKGVTLRDADIAAQTDLIVKDAEAPVFENVKWDIGPKHLGHKSSAK